jgi:hypothetical protein
MRKLVDFINDKWTDPVWSKVFAAAIIGAFSLIWILLKSLFENIPFSKTLKSTYNYLDTNSFNINMLTFVIILFFILVLLIPMIVLKIIQFNLTNIKAPALLKSNKLEFDINGDWICHFTLNETGETDSENVTIVDGNKYLIDGKLYFMLTDIIVNIDKKEIEFTKTSLKGRKHTREVLQIKNNDDFSGPNDAGFQVRYTRQK